MSTTMTTSLFQMVRRSKKEQKVKCKRKETKLFQIADVHNSTVRLQPVVIHAFAVLFLLNPEIYVDRLSILTLFLFCFSCLLSS